jgi:hypothetical protein
LGVRLVSIFSNFDFNVDFALRAILDSDALLTLFKMLMVMVACMSYLLHVCEREVHANIYTDAEFLAPMGHWSQSYFGSIWLVFASLTTLGYADIIPLTYCGRALCFLTVVLGLCIVSVRLAVDSSISFIVFESIVSNWIAGFDRCVQRHVDHAALRAEDARLHVVGRVATRYSQQRGQHHRQRLSVLQGAAAIQSIQRDAANDVLRVSSDQLYGIRSSLPGAPARASEC